MIGIDPRRRCSRFARKHAEEAGLELDLRVGDMGDLDLSRRRTSSLPVSRAPPPADVAGRRRVFERVARALRPGGRFAWNTFVFDHRYACRYDGKWQDEPRRHLTEYSPGDNRVDITLEDGPTLSLWWVARSEWEGLLDVSGLETQALYGWFDRRPFDDVSREFVWIARKSA